MTTEEIFSFENLYQAYLYTRNGKRDKSSVIRYSLHALENINYTKLLLHDRHYNIGEYYEFTVKYPKERIIIMISPPRIPLNKVNISFFYFFEEIKSISKNIYSA